MIALVGGVLATFQPSDPILLDARTRAETEARVGAAKAALGLARAERDRAEAEVLSGLGEGDRGIVHPSDAVADGVAVMARS